MGIWGGLMGPKIENVGFSLVLPLLFEGSRAAWGSQPCKVYPERYSILGVFDVQIMRCLIKHALWLYAELCLPLERGAHFRKKHENKWLKSEKWWLKNEKWCRKSLDGKCDGYMRGLDGGDSIHLQWTFDRISMEFRLNFNRISIELVCRLRTGWPSYAPWWHSYAPRMGIMCRPLWKMSQIYPSREIS